VYAYTVTRDLRAEQQWRPGCLGPARQAAVSRGGLSHTRGLAKASFETWLSCLDKQQPHTSYSRQQHRDSTSTSTLKWLLAAGKALHRRDSTRPVAARMSVHQIQYSEKYFDDIYEYRWAP
jgi:hypothetical protein